LAAGQAMPTPAANTAPTTTPAAIIATAGAPLNFDPRAADADANGDLLTIISAGAPAHGEVAVSPDGTRLTYTPTAGYAGSDTFSYTVAYGHGGVVSGVVNAAVYAANEFTSPVAAMGKDYSDVGTGVPFTAS